MTVFKMWQKAATDKKLPKEWADWGAFRSWVLNNKYKAEYGYKGEFTPNSLLKAMPKPKSEEPKEEAKPEPKKKEPVKEPKEAKKEVKASGQNRKTKKS